MKSIILFLIVAGIGVGFAAPTVLSRSSNLAPNSYEDKVEPPIPQEGMLVAREETLSQGMNLARLEEVIREVVGEVQGKPGFWNFTVSGVRLLCIVDEAHNRMRFMAPVTRVSSLSEKHFSDMLKANFHTTIDARYSISNEIVYTAFLHPLSSLTPEDTRSAIGQVASLVLTFGKTYSSGSLEFGSPKKESSPRPPQSQPF